MAPPRSQNATNAMAIPRLQSQISAQSRCNLEDPDAISGWPLHFGALGVQNSCSPCHFTIGGVPEAFVVPNPRATWLHGWFWPLPLTLVGGLLNYSTFQNGPTMHNKCLAQKPCASVAHPLLRGPHTPRLVPKGRRLQSARRRCMALPTMHLKKRLSPPTQF